MIYRQRLASVFTLLCLSLNCSQLGASQTSAEFVQSLELNSSQNDLPAQYIDLAESKISPVSIEDSTIRHVAVMWRSQVVELAGWIEYCASPNRSLDLPPITRQGADQLIAHLKIA